MSARDLRKQIAAKTFESTAIANIQTILSEQNLRCPEIFQNGNYIKMLIINFNIDCFLKLFLTLVT